MLDKIYDYFVPSTFYKSLDRSDFIIYYSRTKLLVMLGLLLAVTELVLFFYYYLLSGIFNPSHYILLIVCLLIVFGLFRLKKTGDYFFLSWLAFFGFLIFQPLRGYYTGGANAVNYSWFMAGVVLVGSIHRRRVWFLYSFISLIQLCALHFIDGPQMANVVSARLITRITAFIVTFASLWSVFSRDKFIVEETIKLKKKEQGNAMIAALSHEIRNPLAVSLGNVQILERESDSDKVQKVKASLKRIQGVMDKISEIKKSDRINIDFDEKNVASLDLHSLKVNSKD